MKKIPHSLTIAGFVFVATISGLFAHTAKAQTSSSQATQTAAVQPAAHPISPEKDAAIRKLLKISGSTSATMQTITTLVESEKKKADSSVPPEFWNRFLASVKEKDIEDMIIPIYDKHYTLDDINGLITFYGSPLGRKMAAEQAAILIESSEAGQKWGFDKGTAIAKQLADEEAAKANKADRNSK